MSDTKPVGLKIKTVHRYWSSLAPMKPTSDESIVYLQGDRRRTESRREQFDPLWPGGPRVPFYSPHSALIERCDGAAHRAFRLNLDDKTWSPYETFRKLSPEETKRSQEDFARFPTPTKPTREHVVTTNDTGERKQIFGYTARHVITTRTVTRLESGEARQQETVTDGWYIDLDTRIPCDREPPSRREGTTYSRAQLSTRTVSPEGRIVHQLASPPNLVKMTHVGKPETGFAVQVKTTIHYLITGRENIAREQTTTTEISVTELSSEPMDPQLFEVPKGYRELDRILPMLRVAAWARWLKWAHAGWIRIRPARRERRL
jgi:hypothetical protein